MTKLRVPTYSITAKIKGTRKFRVLQYLVRTRRRIQYSTQSIGFLSTDAITYNSLSTSNATRHTKYVQLKSSAMWYPATVL